MKNSETHVWLNQIRLKHIAHNRAATHFAKWHKIIGIPNIVCSTVAGTAIIASLTSSQHLIINIAVGCLSIMSAILATLHIFLEYSATSEKHKTTAAKYGILRRQLEIVRFKGQSEEENIKFFKKLQEKWDTIELEAPSLPQKIHDNALIFMKQMLKEEKEREGEKEITKS